MALIPFDISEACSRATAFCRHTGALFAVPGLITGAASVFDMGGVFTRYNISRDGADADRRAMTNDWIAIGNDMWTAIKEVRREKG